MCNISIKIILKKSRIKYKTKLTIMTTDTNRGWNPRQLRRYDLQLEQIPKLDFQDPIVDELIAQNKPVVITGSNLVLTAQKWNLDYLEQYMGDGDFSVFVSNNHKFKYYDDKKMEYTNKKGQVTKLEFTPPTKKIDMKLPEFIKRLKSWKKGDQRLYLQHGLNNTFGPVIVRDFAHFNWKYCMAKQRLHNWGPLTSNLLLIGMEGNVTPCHYDEQENLFAQIEGHKRCILFSPDQFDCLYPHPVHHPHDRQSMVDFDNPDHERFPKFKEVKGCETVLEPGDVLYIPIYWWHHIESLIDGGYTVTVNFWYKGGQNNARTYPLKAHQKVAVMRNLEKMVLECLQDPNELAPLWKSLVFGRYTDQV